MFNYLKETEPMDYKMWLRQYKGKTIQEVTKVTYDSGNQDEEYNRYLEEWYSDHDLNQDLA